MGGEWLHQYHIPDDDDVANADDDDVANATESSASTSIPASIFTRDGSKARIAPSSLNVDDLATDDAQ